MVSLGNLGGDSNSAAEAVSDDGSVVVGYSTNGDDEEEAFVWTESGGMVGLGNLPEQEYIEAEFVSDDGSVVFGLNRR